MLWLCIWNVKQVPLHVPLEVNVVLVGFNGDGGYRYTVDVHKLEEFLRTSFPSHRPLCMETGEPLDIEHLLVYNVFPVSFTKLCHRLCFLIFCTGLRILIVLLLSFTLQAGQPELIALEKALKEAMVPSGTAREVVTSVIINFFCF